MKGVLDTSVLIAREQNRPLRAHPDEAAISVITLAELQLGIVLSVDTVERARRLRTLATVEREFHALPVDERVASIFAELVGAARRAGRRPRPMDALIAATAVAHDVPLYTQDEDFAALPRVNVVLV